MIVQAKRGGYTLCMNCNLLTSKKPTICAKESIVESSREMWCTTKVAKDCGIIP